jgi:hypothetical protein
METINIPDFGTVVILYTYYYYDGPRLFSCESFAGQKYLSIWVDTDDDFDRWFYVPMSKERLKTVHTGRMTPYEAIKHPEDGWIWNIKTFFDGKSEVLHLNADDINEEDLPSPEIRLQSLDNEQLPTLKATSLVEAKRVNREVLDLILIKDQHIKEISTYDLGQVLARFQSLVWAVAYRDGGIRGRIPQRVVADNTFNVVNTFAASFGVRLESTALGYLFGETLLTPTIELLIKLMKSSNQEELHDILQIIRPRASAQYKAFLDILNYTNMELAASWGSPTDKHDSVSLTKIIIIDTIQMLEAEKDQQIEMIPVNGELVSVNITRNTFGLETEKEHYYGKISENLRGRVFKVPKYVEAKIEVTYDVNPVTLIEHETYTLLEVEEL